MTFQLPKLNLLDKYFSYDILILKVILKEGEK